MTRSLPARISSFLAHPVAMLMIILGLATIWLSAALEIWPLLNGDEAIDASVAWNLLNQGRFATPLYPGLLKLDEAFFLHPPLSILAATGPLGLWGVGLVQARIAPVAFGVLAIGGTYLLGRELYNAKIGTLAALLTLANPLFFVSARTLRPEVFVAALLLVSLFFLVRADKSGRLRHYLAAGLIAGLAVLAHAYSLLWIAAMLSLMVWRGKGQTLRRFQLWTFIAGFALPLLPYAFWVGANWEAYRLQATGYFDFSSGQFWIENILQEIQRYTYWPLTLPSLPLGLAASACALRQFSRHRATLLPLLTFLVGIWFLMPMKSFYYLGVVMPLMNILLAQALWKVALPVNSERISTRSTWLRSAIIALVALWVTTQVGMISWRLTTWGQDGSDYNAFMSVVNRVLLQDGTRPIIGTPFYWLGIGEQLRGSYIARSGLLPRQSEGDWYIPQLPTVKDRAIILMDESWLSLLGGQPDLVTRFAPYSPPEGSLSLLAEIKDPYYAASGGNAGQWQTMRILLWRSY